VFDKSRPPKLDEKLDDEEGNVNEPFDEGLGTWVTTEEEEGGTGKLTSTG
jgi:hypothetical protein